MGPVLVVEDDAEIRQDLTEILGEEGYAVVAVGNGREALAWLADHEPALILLDLMMPIMSGSEFREEQLKSPRLAQIPVVLLSAAAGLPAACVELRLTECLPKPFQLEMLLQTVARLGRRAA